MHSSNPDRRATLDGMTTCVSPAKVNLALHVGAVQPDGYHPVDTICAFVDAGDRLSFRPSKPGDPYTLEVLGPWRRHLGGEALQNNLVLRAARAFRASVNARGADAPGGGFSLYKAVPPASGVGGGTSNGAAALKLLNDASSTPLDANALLKLSEKLGADGPVCTAWHLGQGPLIRARGIGEVISQGPAVAPFALCLANPGHGVPTGAVFKAFDNEPTPTPLTVPQATHPLPTLLTFASQVIGWRNDLACAARRRVPAIEALEDEMRGVPGCLVSRMSGSGATVFGLFSSIHGAERAARRLRGAGLWSVAGPACHTAATIGMQG